MKRRTGKKASPVFTSLINAIANEFENVSMEEDEPVRVYAGLKRTEKQCKIAEPGGEPVYATQKKNIFSYRATDRFTIRDRRQNFFFGRRGIAEKGKGTQSDDLKERVECLREQIGNYANADRGSGVIKGLRAKNGEYVKVGDLLYYVFDVLPRYKT